VNFTAYEWLSLPFAIEVTVATTMEIPSFDEIVGQESLLTIKNNDILSGGENRYFHGVVRKIEYTGMSGRKYIYDLEIVPTIQLLSLKKNCRIFQEKTTQEIIEAIFKDAGIISTRYEFNLSKEEKKRGFCVQYQETDLAFISRLLEEDGSYYYFTHDTDKHVMIITDNLGTHDPLSGNPIITCNSGGLEPETESISYFSLSQKQTSDAYSNGNFNFKKPDLDLNRDSTGSDAPV
jgi:type VI secretion system secreted protein VgrG